MLGQKDRWMTDRALCAPRGSGRGAGLRARARARIGVVWRILLADFFDGDVLHAKTVLEIDFDDRFIHIRPQRVAQPRVPLLEA
jgi:hypothetical protein